MQLLDPEAVAGHEGNLLAVRRDGGTRLAAEHEPLRRHVELADAAIGAVVAQSRSGPEHSHDRPERDGGEDGDCGRDDDGARGVRARGGAAATGGGADARSSKASSAMPTSCAEWNRSAGFLSRQRRRMCSSDCGTPAVAGTSGRSSRRIAAIVSALLARPKARWPVNIS